MIYKRKDSPFWYLESTRKSTGTTDKKDALRKAKLEASRVWAAEQLGIVEHSWQSCVDRWYEAKSSKDSLDRDKTAFDDMWADFKDLNVSQITQDKVRAYAKRVAGRESSSMANANRNLVVLRSLLNQLVKWEWLTKAPRVEMFTIPKDERYVPMWITVDQFDAKLAPELPPHVANLAEVLLFTGMRYSNVARMEWSWLSPDFKTATVPAISSKTKRVYTVPIATRAQAVIKAQQGKHGTYVFTDHMNRAPIGSVKTAWNKATTRAGLAGLKVHELRHSWTSLHLKAGTPDRVIVKNAGWATPAMLHRYGHTTDKDAADYADNIGTVPNSSAGQ